MTVPVFDPFGVARDAGMPFLAQAIDSLAVGDQFQRHLLRLTGESGRVILRAIRVIRYKPGRRCLIEYDLEVQQPDAPARALTLVGKARARGLDESTYRLLESLRIAGFGGDSSDGVSVPEPVGVIPEFQMWLQRKVNGELATSLLAEPDATTLARRIAEAAHKLHRADIPSGRRHTMTDELRILHERLTIVAQLKPEWRKRLDRVLAACDRLGAATPPPTACGIHRDFYADHVVVDGPRLCLLDFDLYREGDPALDIGNFLGHLVEQSLRTLGGAHALEKRQQAMEQRFVELAGEATRPAVRAYTTLTLVRHIYLSTQFPERRPFTERVLEICEQRLDLN